MAGAEAGLPQPPQPTLLLTGFEPFGGDAVNPSALVVQALHGQTIAGWRVVGVCLPCVFGDAGASLRSALRRHRPATVVALGLAASRGEITPERIAINVDDARIACNAGRQPIDEPVIAGAPAAYFSTLPIKAIVAALGDAGLPASVSQSAGTFVCNHVFFTLMHALRRRRALRGGFIHLPALPKQSPAGLALAEQIRGVRIAIGVVCCAGPGADLRAVGGAIA